MCVCMYVVWQASEGVRAGWTRAKEAVRRVLDARRVRAQERAHRVSSTEDAIHMQSFSFAGIGGGLGFAGATGT